MRHIARFVVLPCAALVTALLLAAAPAYAQGLPGGRPADAIDHARGLATQPFIMLPPVERPSERYVAPRRVYSPTLQKEVEVPGHYETNVNGQRVEVPPLVTTTPDGRHPTVTPGGERPPIEERSGP